MYDDTSLLKFWQYCIPIPPINGKGEKEQKKGGYKAPSFRFNYKLKAPLYNISRISHLITMAQDIINSL